MTRVLCIGTVKFVDLVLAGNQAEILRVGEVIGGFLDDNDCEWYRVKVDNETRIMPEDKIRFVRTHDGKWQPYSQFKKGDD